MAHVHLACQAPRLSTLWSDLCLSDGHLVSSSDTASDARARMSQQPVDALIVHVRGSGRAAARLLRHLATDRRPPFVVLVGPDRISTRAIRSYPQSRLRKLPLPVAAGRLRATLAEGLRQNPPGRDTDALSIAPRAMPAVGTSPRACHDRLLAVNALCQAISGSLDMDEIISTAFTRLSHLVPVDLLGLAWSTGHCIRVRASDRVPTSHVDRVRAWLGSSATPSAATKRTKTISLQVGERITGCFHAERVAGRSFTAEDAVLLDAIAGWIALALKHAEVHRRVTTLALTDALTGLLNRRALDEHLTRALRAADRYGSPACLIMADLDHFKAINDRLGHPRGDAILQAVATVISRSVRTVDLVARYGGEEFAILLPHTNLRSAKILADRLLKGVRADLARQGHDELHLTVSLGLAAIPTSGTADSASWIAAADEALYRAKANGRNRVETASTEGLREEPAPLVGLAGH